MGSSEKVSVVIPAYNEELSVREAVVATAHYLETLARDWEIVIVNDGSRDDTLRQAQAVAVELGEKVRVLSHAANQGKGAAVKTGVLAAQGEYVIFCDADGATPIQEISKFLPVLERGTDVAAGSRRMVQSQIKHRQPKIRQWMGTVYVRLTHLLMGFRVSDITCGFKGLRRAAAHDIFSKMTVTGWSFDAEMFYLAKKRGYQVSEIPIEWADKPNTKVRLVEDAVRSFWELLKIRINDLSGAYRSS